MKFSIYLNRRVSVMIFIFYLGVFSALKAILLDSIV